MIYRAFLGLFLAAWATTNVLAQENHSTDSKPWALGLERAEELLDDCSGGAQDCAARREEARAILEKAIPSSPSTENDLIGRAKCLRLLARIHIVRSEVGPSLRVLKESLAIQRQINEDRAKEFASTLDDLAFALELQDRDPESVQITRMVHSYREASLGAEHPDLITGLRLLSMIAGEEGDLELEERLALRALAIAEGAYGQIHPEVRQQVWRLQSIYEKRGRLEEAEQAKQRADRISRALREKREDER